MKPYIISGALVLMGSTLIACSGGGGGGNSLAGGGISGTGSGTITAFGSIVLNDGSHIQTTNSNVVIDGTTASESALDIGMVAEVDISNTDDQLSAGDADEIRVHHEIKGIVTGLSPLQVLGQTIVTNGSTIFQSESDPRPAPGPIDPATLSTFTASDLALGEEVEVSGRRDDNQVVQASRIERKTTSLDRWQITGRISGLNTATRTFNLSDQGIDYSSASVDDCDGGLSDGLRVEVKATPVAGFVPGSTLSVTEVECKPEAINFGGSATGSIVAEIEGFVTSAAVASFASSGTGSFTIGDQQVNISTSTAFEGGTSEDIVQGVKLDARGTYDLLTRILDANRIRFRNTRFRLEGPATSVTGTEVQLLGLTVTVNEQSEVETGLDNTKQIKVKGYIDSDGTLIADEVEKEDDVQNPNDVRARGRVDSGSVTGNGLDNNYVFTLFNGALTIDASSATKFEISDASVSAVQFRNALLKGAEVDVEHGQLSGTTIINAQLQIEIEDEEGDDD